MKEEFCSDDDMERTCSDCGTLLVNEKGITVKEVFIMDFALWCQDCLEGKGIIALHKKGKDVKREFWFLES